MTTTNDTGKSERTRGRRVRVAALVVPALLLAACSASADADTATTAPQTTVATETTTATTAAPTTTQVVESEEELVVEVDEEGTTAVEATNLDDRLEALPVGELTEEEIDGLLWMREEEKLAHDVYVALYDMWGQRVFTNIANAEETHTDAVKTLLERYGIEDIAAGNPEGVFTNPEIQALYDQLIARGSTSLVDALLVGATIEDLDIVDLQDRASLTEDIALVYASLERGSRNHMRAFTSNLERQGETYTPVFLSQEAFDEIVSTPMERGPNA